MKRLTLTLILALLISPLAEAKGWSFLNTSKESDKWLRSQILAGAAETALIHWDDKISGTALGKSETGKALMGYLMAQSGLKVSGLKYMAQHVDFSRVNAELKDELSKAYPLNSAAWEALADIRTKSGWSQGWIDPAIVAVAMKGPSYKITSRGEASRLLKIAAQAKEANQKAVLIYPLALFALTENKVRVAEDLLAELELLEQTTVPEDRIFLARARGLFQEKRFREALAYYGRIGKGSDYWLTVQEESAWAHLQLKEPDKALSLLHSSRAPIFHPISHAEPYSLASYIFLKLCDYGEVFKVLKEFRTAFTDKLTLLQAVRDGKSDSHISSVYQKWAQADLDWKAVGREVNGLPLLFYRDEVILAAMSKWWLPQKEMNIVQTLIGRAVPKGQLIGHLMDVKASLRPLLSSKYQAQQIKVALDRTKVMARGEVQTIGSVIQEMHIMEAESAQRLYAYAQVDPNLKGEFVDKRRPEGDVLYFPANSDELWLDEIDSYRYKVRGCESSKEIKS